MTSGRRVFDMAPDRRGVADPYYRCELHCNHDLGAGMSVSELLGQSDPPQAALLPRDLRGHRPSLSPPTLALALAPRS